MKTSILIQLGLALYLLLAPTSAFAGTRIQQLGYDAPDGARITGFMYFEAETPKDAPVAILMHGLMGSSLFWLAADNYAHGDDLTAMLIERGYRVVALDARAHGARGDDKSPYERVMGARQGDADSYQQMIEATVGDYQFLLDKVMSNFADTKEIVAIGYSMGAQMGTLLAAQDERVTALVTLVPPAARNVPAVSPIEFASKVHIPWLLVTAENDQFSTPEQNAELVAAGGKTLTNVSFDSGHLLPGTYVQTVSNWLEAE